MTDSPTGIIPEELMFKRYRTQVKAWIAAQPLPAHIKRELLFAWARTVGTRMHAKEVQAVMDTGVATAKQTE